METSRVQLALNVSDIDAATRFYTNMFGVGPAKQRAGYANFEIADPPLKLVLFEHPTATSALNHLGVEVRSTADVVAAAERFTSAGLTHHMAESDRCCHAVQDKLWLDAPDVPLGGWEVYTVLADDPDQDTAGTDSVCCTTTSSDSPPCCAGTPESYAVSTAAVLVEGVHVRFGGVHALAGIDFAAPAGSTLAVLGHNGAGKTTLIRVLTTLIRPDAGRALVDGFDVVDDPDRVRRRIGVTGQYAGLDEYLTGRENLELVGRLGGAGTRSRARARALIDRLALDDIAERRVGELSGGSRRRIDLAASLVGEPSVLFLDEPTTGLDPSARIALWELVGELTADGTTVVLTTQYLDEADRLADDIVVLDHGQISARGTPAELKRLVGGKVVTATIDSAALSRLAQRPHEVRAADASRSHIAYSTTDAESAARVVATLTTEGVSFDDLAITSPTLDDVFAHLTLEGIQS